MVVRNVRVSREAGAVLGGIGLMLALENMFHVLLQFL